MFADLQNETELDARTLLNAQIAYRANRFTVTAYGKNLLDEVYRTTEGPGLSPGTVVVRLGDPAEYGLRLQFGF